MPLKSPSKLPANRPPFWAAFGRSQVASLVATIVDFGVLVLLVEIFAVWYVLATALGAGLGAITNFLLGRFWCFKAQDGSFSQQAIRYGSVSAGSLLLNSGGVFILTDGFGLKYVLSKACVSIGVGFFYNFPLQRWFVFD